MAKKKLGMEYKGKPLYRKGDRIFYGNLEDKYILVLDILEKKKIKKIIVATKVRVQIQDNENEQIGNGKVFRKSEKENLHKALDIGSRWLQGAIDEAQA